MGRYNKIKGLEIQLQLIKKINKFKDEFRIFFVGPNCKEKKKLIEKTEMLNLKKMYFFYHLYILIKGLKCYMTVI